MQQQIARAFLKGVRHLWSESDPSFVEDAPTIAGGCSLRPFCTARADSSPCLNANENAGRSSGEEALQLPRVRLHCAVPPVSRDFQAFSRARFALGLWHANGRGAETLQTPAWPACNIPRPNECERSCENARRCRSKAC